MIGQHYRPLLNLSSLLATSGGARPLFGATAACYAEVRKQTRQQLSNRSHFPGSFAVVNTARGQSWKQEVWSNCQPANWKYFPPSNGHSSHSCRPEHSPAEHWRAAMGPVSLLYHPDMAQAGEKRVHVFIHEKYITGNVGWIKIPT